MKKVVFMLIGASLTISAMAQNSAVNKAASYQKDGELDLAKEQIDLAVVHEKTLDDPKTWYTKGLIYQAIGTSENATYLAMAPDAIEQATAAYNKAIELAKEGSTYYIFAEQQLSTFHGTVLNAAITDYQAGNLEEAIVQFEQSAMIQPQDTTGYLYAAMVSTEDQQYDRALENFQKLIDMDRASIEVYGGVIDIYSNQKKDLESALKYTVLGREKFPDNVNLMRNEINLLIMMEKADEARAKLEEAIAIEPSEALYFNLAILNDQTGDMDGARDAYLKAIELNPTYYEANFNLGVLYYNEAAEILKEANNMDLRTYQKQGPALEAKAKEKFKVAMPYFVAAQEARPDDMSSLETLQTIYTQLKMNDKAEEMLNKIDALKAGQ